ncbi:hypothetical protein NW766_001475 [Fusarium irregulare]|uniref:CCHC-type domain-containing protein n=1 Tax=Fusarium irregulare TaxID=2494466 RepID=A0A9W8UD60_9HYPO|nr:hypothetical protein NW766_001475 [Fusarium irregulare]
MSNFKPFAGDPVPKLSQNPPYPFKKRKGNDKCYVYQGLGHIAKDCPVEEEKRSKYMQNRAKMAE